MLEKRGIFGILYHNFFHSFYFSSFTFQLRSQGLRSRVLGLQGILFSRGIGIAFASANDGWTRLEAFIQLFKEGCRIARRIVSDNFFGIRFIDASDGLCQLAAWIGLDLLDPLEPSTGYKGAAGFDIMGQDFGVL